MGATCLWYVAIGLEGVNVTKFPSNVIGILIWYRNDNKAAFSGANETES